MSNRKKIFAITQAAVLLAVLIVLQAATKGFGQFVTGSCVNAVLALAALSAPLGAAVMIALVSPVLAFLLGIAPQILTVPAIMAANAVYVLALHFLTGRRIVRQICAWLAAAAVKFAVLYAAVIWLVCGVLQAPLMNAGLLKMPMRNVLTATFSWPQLVTALIGGAVAMLCVPTLKKALKII